MFLLIWWTVNNMWRRLHLETCEVLIDTSSLLVTSILLSILSTNTFSLGSSLRAGDGVTHPHKTAYKNSNAVMKIYNQWRDKEKENGFKTISQIRTYRGNVNSCVQIFNSLSFIVAVRTEGFINHKRNNRCYAQINYCFRAIQFRIPTSCHTDVADHNWHL
jgi:hypothetical protein